MKLSIALFGTSADPPTAGHRTILASLSEQYDIVAVWASDNPFKSHQTSLAHRSAMLRVMIQEISTPESNIFVCEELSNRRSLISVEKAQAIWGKDAEYSLVIGSDLLPQIFRWYQFPELLEKVTILIIPRPGYLIETKNLQKIRDLGGKYTITAVNPPAVSSTAYREYRDENAITKSVADYIHQQQLYV